MKNIKTNLLIATFVLLILALPACKKNSDGGDAEVHAKITNNGTPINNAHVYIKFGTTTQPSDPTTNYDLMAHGESTDNHVHIEGLRPGDYYLYATGTNTATGKAVKGGTSVSIAWKERKDMIDADVEVSE